MNNLFQLLRNSGAGCCIGDYYAGVFGYADDLLLLCPSRDGLQKMLKIAEDYANSHKIAFSTHPDPVKSKTKGILFTKRHIERLPAPVSLNGDPLPWVQSGKYLGNQMTSIQDGYQKDASSKRAQFIDRNINLNQEFSLAHPELKSRINQIYNSSFYGSVLWDLKGEKTKQLINSWSFAVREMWNLPFNAHRGFVEPLGGFHAQVLIFSRYIGFLQSTRKSNKMVVKYLLEKVLLDLNTITGQNVRYILEKCDERDIMKINPGQFKKNFKFSELPEDELWKVNIIKEITNINQNVLVLNENVNDDEEVAFTREELEEIMNFVATF